MADDFRTLSGIQKAAVFLLAMGDSEGGIILEKLDDEEIRELTQVMIDLGSISASLVERVLMDFVDSINSGTGVTGDMFAAEKFLKQSLSKERVQTIMEEIRGPAGRTMWDKLSNIHESVLANYLKNEYPQTVAVIISKIKPDHAARMLSQLPENYAMEVIFRLLKMEPVQKEVLDSLEKTLRNEFMSTLMQSQRRDPYEMTASIFNNLERGVEARFMATLEEHSRDAAERVRNLMFTFDDIKRVNASGIQVILREADRDKLALALKGASNELKTLFFSNMSERSAKIIQEDIEAMGGVRLRDVEEAQQEIVELTKRLSESQEIVVAGSGKEGEMIY